MVSLIIGLGNIGDRYRNTRHNVGFAVIETVARLCGKNLSKGIGDFGVTKINYENKTARLIRPRTYMNHSGIAAKGSSDRFEIKPEEILIVYDDIYLPVGTIRIRERGSDGGHKGMESVIYHLGTEEVARLRVGIGPKPEEIDQSDFVLSRFSLAEAEILEKVLGKSAEAVLYLLSHRPEEAMRKYNRNPASDDESSGAV